MTNPASLVCVALTIILTVYGQIVVKWQVAGLGTLPADFFEKLQALAGLLINPWIISVFVAAFLAAMSWMAAMTRLELSYAYPFVSLTFPSVLILSVLFFNEPIGWQKIVGIVFIVTGVVIGSLSAS